MAEILDDKILLTLFLRHDQSNNLDAVAAKLREGGWYEHFPPAGVRIVSWTVAMSFGQVVTLEVPASKLAALNIEIERRAWGVFRTECIPTYDFVPIRNHIRENLLGKGEQ